MVADSTTAGDPEAVLEGAAARLVGAGTVLVLFGDPESGEAELCVVRRTARRTAVRRATVAVDDPERIPELLAKRALELLRATALELSLEIEPAPRAEKPAARLPQAEIASSSMARAPAPDAAIVVVDMGVGMWNSVEGPPAALVAVGRVGLRLSRWAWARVSVAGFGSRPRVDTAYGSASLSQTMALARVRRDVPTRQTRTPHVHPRRRRPRRGRRGDGSGALRRSRDATLVDGLRRGRRRRVRCRRARRA